MCSVERANCSGFRLKRAFRSIFKRSCSAGHQDADKFAKAADPHYEEIADNTANEEILLISSLGIPNHFVRADFVLVSSARTVDGVFFWKTMDCAVDADLYQP